MQLVAGTAAAPTTYPLGGYVNMNQLAHMALQHQGLCPVNEKKHSDEDLTHQQSQAGGYRADQWENVGPRGAPPNQHVVDNSGIGMLTYCWDCVCMLDRCMMIGRYA